MKITDYAEELLNDIDKLEDWPESVKTMQRNWIGKSKGLNINFKSDNDENLFTAFTTRPDTLFGVTYIAISINHQLSNSLAKSHIHIKNFITKYQQLKVSEETSAKVEKDGVFTGAYCLHPISHKKIPIWIANYVLDNYGTGVVMGVPAHDARDYDFAKKFRIEIIEVIHNPEESTHLPYLASGILKNSFEFDNMDSGEAKKRFLSIV